jgi:hypothetical protein
VEPRALLKQELLVQTRTATRSTPFAVLLSVPIRKFGDFRSSLMQLNVWNLSSNTDAVLPTREPEYTDDGTTGELRSVLIAVPRPPSTTRNAISLSLPPTKATNSSRSALALFSSQC